MGIRSDTVLAEACKLIETCGMSQASDMLNDALVSDLGNQSLVFAIQGCNFWRLCFSAIQDMGCFERGETLVEQWCQFKKLIQKQEEPDESTVYSFTKGVFSFALEQYSKASSEKDTGLQSEICRKKGLCYKKLGSYETALSCLMEANEVMPGQAAVVAEMADCYALCGEAKYAKLLFREAFFIDAQKVNLDFLDAPLINLLVDEVRKAGYDGVVLLEWIPVYGVLLNVLNVKRELRSQEFLRLKQDIFSRESELKDSSFTDTTLCTPRLLNLYFWLIDYYVLSKASVSKINEVLLKIKLLDKEIYQRYVK